MSFPQLDSEQLISEYSPLAQAQDPRLQNTSTELVFLQNGYFHIGVSVFNTTVQDRRVLSKIFF